VLGADFAIFRLFSACLRSESGVMMRKTGAAWLIRPDLTQLLVSKCLFQPFVPVSEGQNEDRE
jgi:hypothetical protein